MTPTHGLRHGHRVDRRGRRRRHAAGRRGHDLELGQDFVGTLPPIGRELLQTAHHHARQGRLHRRPVFLDRIRLLCHVRCQDRLRRGRRERRLAAQHLVGHDPQGVDVGPVVGVGIGRRLFGGHVGRRSQRHAQRGQRRARVTARSSHRLGDAEVGHQGVLARQHHVVGLDVAVDHALGVSVRQGIGHVPHDAERVANRKAPLAGQLGAQRFALDIRHDVVQQVAFGAGRQ